MKVYLSGGLYTTWRDDVRVGVPNAIFLDPTRPRLPVPAHYTSADLLGIKMCDVLFAYLEEGVYGVGTALEVGFAKAMGKTVIFAGDIHRPGFAMVREAADVVAPDLETSITILQRLSTLWQPS